MLQSIRDKAQGWIAYVIVFLISIPFALWGIQEYTGIGKEPVVAKVGDSELLQREVTTRLNNLRSTLLEQFQGKLPPMFSDEQLRKQVVDSMINEELLAQKTAELNVRAGDAMVSEQIRSIEAFQVNGRFDPEAYRRSVQVRGLTSKMFEEQVRLSLGSQMVRGAISDSEPVTDAEIDALLKLKNQRRTVSWMTVDAAKVTDVPEVTDADIEKHYNENKELYPKPEQVRLEYIQLNLDSISQGITIDEKLVREYYDDPEQQKQFISEETRNMRHILIKVDANRNDDDAKKEAERILAELKAGGDFAVLAKEFSEDKGSGARGGDLGEVKRGVMVKPFEDAGFALEKGQISDLVRSRFGYHIIQVTDIKGGDIQPFEAVREQIAVELKRKEAATQFADKYDILGNLSYATPDSLKPAADALGISARQSDWVPKTGAIGTFSHPKIISTVFSEDALQNRLNSEVIELSADDYIVVRVIDFEPQSIKPLEEVKLVIRNKLEAENKKNVVENKAKALLAEIESGKSIDEIAEETSFKLEKEKSIGRDEAGVPGSVRNKVFRMRLADGKDSSLDLAELGNGSYAIVKLHSVTEGDPGSVTKEERDNERRKIAAARGRTLLSSYIEGLRDEIGVTLVEN